MKKLVIVLLCLFSVACLTSCSTEGNDSSSGYGEHNYSRKYSKSSGSAETSSLSFSSNESANSEASGFFSYDSSKTDGQGNFENSSNTQNDKSDSTSTNSSDSKSDSSNSGTTITYYYYTTEDNDPGNETSSENESRNDSDSSGSESSSTDSDAEDTDISTDTDDTDTSSGSDTDVSPEVQLVEGDLVLSYGDTRITYETDIDKLIDAINEQPLHIEKIPNPDNPEFDILIYNFEHFSIEAVPSADGTEYYASSMEAFDESVETNKGVHVGMTLEQVTAVYGTAEVIRDDEHRYYVCDRYLYMYVQNDIVANIGFGKDVDSDAVS